MNPAVIIDNGSGSIKAGLASETKPKCVFPNYLGTPKHVRVMRGGLEEGEILVGDKAEIHKGVLSLRYPMEHGSVVNWDDMETVWRYMYGPNALNVDPEEHPVLLTVVPLDSKVNYEKSAEVFFETFNVPALHMAMNAVLSLYATGRTTGVLFDSGEGVSYAVPIYQGYAVPHCVNRVDVAGRDVTNYLRNLLKEEASTRRALAEEIVRSVKESCCYVASDPENEETQTKPFQLPDGTTIELGSVRHGAPEALFNPALIGEEACGIHKVVLDAINSSDINIRKILYESIVLSGGTTLLEGLGNRMLLELKSVAPKNVKIRLTLPQERLYSGWIGGSILASLEDFNNVWITKRDFHENGAHNLVSKLF